MFYAKLPRTNIEVSRICLGTMTFGSPVSEKDAIHLIQYALGDCGINFVDTANMYEGYNRYAGSAGGVAEEIIGKAVEGHRHDYVLATKVGMKVGNEPVDENTSPAAIHTQLTRSLRRMKTDYVDLFYLHRFDPDTAPAEIARALGEELKAGRILSWGVSNYSAEQLEHLLDAAKAENIPFPSLCQPALSLLNTAAMEDVLPLCVKNDIGVIPYQLLQGGLLTGKYRRDALPPEGSRMAEKPGWMKPVSEEGWEIIENTAKQAREEGITMTQYALRWALRQKGVVSALIGVKREEQVKEAALAAISL